MEYLESPQTVLRESSDSPWMLSGVLRESIDSPWTPSGVLRESIDSLRSPQRVLRESMDSRIFRESLECPESP
jgi:hypothetical protein